MESTLGPKVRAIRRSRGITQAELARRLGISASYLNLIEHNRRAFTADLLVRLAECLPIDIKTLSTAQDGRAITELLEAFGDPLFENLDVVAAEVKEFATNSPTAAQGVLRLYEAYRSARESAYNLGNKLLSGSELPGIFASKLPTEEVNDLLQRHLNYFPELEEGAEALTRDAHLERDFLFNGLATYLQETKGIEVRIEQPGNMQGAFRRYDPAKKILSLSEALRRGSRNFQLAHQVGLLTQDDILKRIANDPLITTDESRALSRVVLASYFAGCVLMPYTAFLQAAQDERYDIDLLGHRFRASFEQTCHRLTSLRRPGAEGIPFHQIRIDIAGNISKRFSASGIRFPRFGGACPRWNVFEAFLTPGMIRPQLSQFPDGQVYFEVARTVRKASGGHRGPRAQYAISLGCEVSYAREMVYADGLDLTSREALVTVGPTCRLCDRMDCEQRAYPPVQQPLAVNEDVRGVSFYAPPSS